MASVECSFDHRHYVPILRQKYAEMEALRYLLSADKQHVTPLIELPPTLIKRYRKKLTNSSDFFREIAIEIAGAWGQAPLFIDIKLLCTVYGLPGGPHPLWSFSDVARTLRLPIIIPVTGLNRSQGYQMAVGKVVAADGRGVCVRLLEADLYDPLLEKRLRGLLDSLKIEPKQTDLLVDFKLIGSKWMDFTELCRRLPLLSAWRTFTVASGAFPKDLSDFAKNGQYELSRDDWLHWFNQVKNGASLTRRPSFSDYTIQHPVYSAPLDKPNISASIRYTAEKYWVIMRGEGLRNEGGAGFDQYWANAQLLSERKEFSGPNFSRGDNYIYTIGQQNKKTGNPTTWLEAGINHHLTYVTRQIASSFESSTGGVPGNGSGPGLRPRRVSRIPAREASNAGLQPYQVPLIS